MINLRAPFVSLVSICLLGAVLLGAGPAPTTAAVKDAIRPPNDTVINTAIIPGNDVLLTVSILYPDTRGTVVNLSTDNSGFFSYLPSSVTIPAGSTSVQVTAHVSSTATGGCALIAYNSAGYVTKLIALPTETGFPPSQNGHLTIGF